MHACLDDDLSIALMTGGGSVGELTATQDAINRVQVSWTPPSSPPSRGYQLRVVSEGIVLMVFPGTSQTLTIEPFGVRRIEVEPRSSHYPSAGMTREVTIRGESCDALKRVCILY